MYTQGLLTIANKIFSTLALAATAFRLTPADLARAAQPAGPGGPHLPVWRDTSSGGPHLGRLEGPMQEGPSRRTTSRRDSSSGYRRFLRETPTSRRASSSGPPLPLGNFSSHTVFRVFAISTFDVYAHSLIGSVRDPYASTSIFCFCPPPPPSFTHLILAHFTPIFLCLYPRTRDVYFGGLLLLASSFLFEDHRSSSLSATSCDKNGTIDL